MTKKRASLFELSLIGAVIAFALVVIFTPTRTPEEKAARSIAKREAYKRGWTYVVVKSATYEHDRWVVRIEHFPPYLGGHAKVEIVGEEVVRYFGGK